MFKSGFGDSGDFEALGRQYWSAWGEAMRQAGLGGVAPAPAPAPGSQHWQQALDWWTQLMPAGRSPANDAVGRFNQQARDWYGQMQQLAAQFAGQDSSASDVGQAWRRALGAQGEGNPFSDMFKAMRGPGAHGMDEWLEQVKPFFGDFQQHAQRWQQLPAFGQYREHQERWQALQLAQQDYQQRSDAFNGLMLKCAQRAFEAFEDKLAAREEPGRQITSARALFDLWIDAAEQAYGEIALSLEFRQLSGALNNAQMRLRAGIQREVELLGGLFGMPSRTEVDSAHRKIADLERALRRAGNAANRPERPIAQGRTTRAPEPTPPPAAEPAVRSKPVPGNPVRKATAAKPARAPVKSLRTPVKRKAVPARPAAGKRAARAVATTASKASPVQVASNKNTPPKRAATRRAAVPVKKATTRTAGGKTGAERPTPAKAAAKRTTQARRGAAARPAAKAPSANAATGNKPASQVVSMKDWVARYAAGNLPEPRQSTAAGKGGSKGSRK